jgi:hypothetical protein
VADLLQRGVDRDDEDAAAHADGKPFKWYLSSIFLLLKR